MYFRPKLFQSAKLNVCVFEREREKGRYFVSFQPICALSRTDFCLLLKLIKIFTDGGKAYILVKKDRLLRTDFKTRAFIKCSYYIFSQQTKQPKGLCQGISLKYFLHLLLLRVCLF